MPVFLIMVPSHGSAVAKSLGVAPRAENILKGAKAEGKEHGRGQMKHKDLLMSTYEDTQE